MTVYWEIARTGRDTAVAIGMFDGLHRGHQMVIDRAVAEKENQLVPMVLTFSTDRAEPARKQGMKKILTGSLALKRLDEIGLELVEIASFERIKELSPREFVKIVLADRLQAKVVVCGQDFRFGANASGNVSLLGELCAEFGIRLEVVEPLMDDGMPVSSTRIRKALEVGNIEEANRLLGYPYSFDFEVAHGLEIGRTIGIPTINQIFPENFLVPKFGVYASYTMLGGVTHKSITNIGVKPTIAGERLPLAETHIMGVDNRLYGQRIPVSLMKFIRPERKFDSINELKAEIQANIEQINALLD